MGFCRVGVLKKITWWTISALKAAAYLYRDAGFVVTREKTHEIWGATRTEQEYELILNENENQ